MTEIEKLQLELEEFKKKVKVAEQTLSQYKRIKQKHKESLDIIKKERHFTSSIIESSQQAIIAINKYQKVVIYNKKAQEIFGFTKKEMLYKDTLHNIIPKEYSHKHFKAVANFINTKESIGVINNKFELEAQKKDGTIFPIRISFGVNIEDDDITIIANIDDITIEKAQQETIEQQNKLAAMGEMLGNIAHQWRQPLSVISTAASGMQMQKEYNILSDESFNQFCNTINDNTQYLSKTIDDFQNFIKGTNEKKLFILNDEITKLLNLVKGVIKQHSINIIINIDETLQIDGYENELTQCFLNIFNNSKDALISQNIENKLFFISACKKDDKTIITFKDNANGIPKDILPKIFDPYFTTKHQSQGTGLGLNMTYKLIVELMQGTISARNVTYTYEDTKYTGAMFVITI